MQQRGFGVDSTVLQAQVGAQEQWESFQLHTQQTVLTGLMGQTGSDITQSDTQAALHPESDARYSYLISQTTYHKATQQALKK